MPHRTSTRNQGKAQTPQTPYTPYTDEEIRTLAYNAAVQHCTPSSLARPEQLPSNERIYLTYHPYAAHTLSRSQVRAALGQTGYRLCPHACTSDRAFFKATRAPRGLCGGKGFFDDEVDEELGRSAIWGCVVRGCTARGWVEREVTGVVTVEVVR